MPKTFYVNFYDPIDPPKVKAIMAFCSDVIAKESPDVLYFLFSSSGGSVDAGITLYNFLMALPCEIVMHNTGSIDSIATIVFLAASKRYACHHSAFLIHGMQWNFPQGATLTIPQLQENLSRAKVDESKMTGIYTERSNLTADTMSALFAQGESKDVGFALKSGIIQEIKNPSIPKGSPIISFNLLP